MSSNLIQCCFMQQAEQQYSVISRQRVWKKRTKKTIRLKWRTSIGWCKSEEEIKNFQPFVWLDRSFTSFHVKNACSHPLMSPFVINFQQWVQFTLKNGNLTKHTGLSLWLPKALKSAIKWAFITNDSRVNKRVLLMLLPLLLLLLFMTAENRCKDVDEKSQP